ncbi:hypothetical protein AB0G04_18000 [Actinoplanes sp. NPDC023801]
MVELPAVVVATTVTVSVRPLVRPAIVHVVGPLLVQLCPPGEVVAV